MENLDDNALNIYTDGSSYPGPRMGGTGFLFIAVDESGNAEIREDSPHGWRGATNNQMELQACIDAMNIATGRHPPFDRSFPKIVIRTDSKYVTENVGTAIHVWSANGWKTKAGGPVLNTPQWKALLSLIRRASRAHTRVEIRWVKGHKDDVYNQRVDELAKQSAKRARKPNIRPARVRRKLSPHRAVIGSIRAEGQVATIRVIVEEYLRAPHRCFRYMYEVMDEESPYYQRVDWLTADVVLRVGHTYSVRLNADQGNPRIAELLAEIPTSASDEPA